MSQTDYSHHEGRGQSTNSDNANILAALGTLIGYIGAEAATDRIFDRLLWPQRFWSGLSITNVWRAALLQPMGGPLHRAALHTMDEFFKHNLFSGDSVGNMLGTAFFRDSKLTYRAWTPDQSQQAGTKSVRNGLWIHAIAQIAIPEARLEANTEPENACKGKLRARTSVHFISLDVARPSDDSNVVPVDEDSYETLSKVYLGIICSELTGIIIGLLVSIIWKSYFALLWFSPLVLKLTSAVFALDREGLRTKTNYENKEEIPRLFEIVHPNRGIFVLQGPTSLVLQFFRHYGHPIRNRRREIIQLSIVVCFGLIFPAGLLSSTLWMPLPIQYIWFSYQLYTTLAMHICRYTNSYFWATTEELIAQRFLERKSTNIDRQVFLRDRNGQTVVVTLTTTYWDSIEAAREEANRVLAFCYFKD